MQKIKKQINKVNKERGITLVALVVTIIILLILAGISINALFGDSGIIIQAMNAKKQNQISGEKETVETTVINFMSNRDIEDFEEFKQYIKENIKNNEINVIQGTDNIIVEFIDSKNYYAVDNDGNVNWYDYEYTLDYYKDKGEIKVGDYFEYKITNFENDGIFDIKKELSGYTENQQLDASTYEGKWRVLYNGEEGYGVQIVSSENVLGTDNIKLKGKEGYNNLVEILNTAAGNYIEKNYAISARALGSNPNDTETSKGDQTLVEEKRPNINDNVFNLTKDYKAEDENYKFDEVQLNLYNNKFNYTIRYASRHIAAGYHYGGDGDFCIRGVFNEASVPQTELAVVNGNGYYEAVGQSIQLIPVIKMRGDIELTQTNDTNGNTVWTVNSEIK